MRIGGVPVLGGLADIALLAATHRVQELLVSTDSISSKQLRSLVADSRQLGFRVKIIPSYEQLLDQRVEIQPRSVAIEDLLRREPVRLDMNNIHDWIDGRIVMVTGSAGSIGSEICRQLLQFRPEQIVLVDRSESGQFFLERELQALAPDQKLEVCMADITDRGRIETLMRRYRPEIIFHAAAYKHVPLMETNPGEAVKNTVQATRNLAELAERYGVGSFVMISTDKAVNPSSVMGACKRLAELYVQALADGGARCKFVTVRFGNVLDSAGSVVPIFRSQIAAGGPVTVTHPDMTRYFMTIPEASQLVIQAGAMGTGGEIFVLDMGEAVRIVDLAADMIRLSGLRVDEDIEIEFTGLRPGEKLVEELFDHQEQHACTRHEKIMVAVGGRYEMQRVQWAIAHLSGIVESPTPVVIQEIHDTLGSFQHHAAEIHVSGRRAA
jgi:FlaA1/EpsC-like NDP-sugar epimerase